MTTENRTKTKRLNIRTSESRLTAIKNLAERRQESITATMEAAVSLLAELQDVAEAGSSALLLKPLRRDFKMVAHQSQTIEFGNYLQEQAMNKPEWLRELFEALNGWLRASGTNDAERESTARFIVLANLQMIRDGI